jgi:acyl carrier protein
MTTANRRTDGADRIEEIDCVGAVRRALAGQAGLSPDEIALTDAFRTIPGMESVRVLRAIVDIERECGVVVPDDFLFESATVADLVALVSSLVETAP